MLKIKFKVNEIVYLNKETNYAILTGKILELGEETTRDFKITGIMPSVYIDDVFKGEGCFKESRYGLQFNLEEYEKIGDSSINGIADFLIQNIKGVGKVTVNKLISCYGINTLEEIQKGVENIEKAGIDNKKANNIYNHFMKNIIFKEFNFYMMPFSFGSKKNLKLWEKYTNNVMDIVKNRVFEITDILKFKEIDMLYYNNPNNKGYYSNIRLKTVLINVLKQEAQETGHMFLYLKDYYVLINDYLNKNSFFKYEFLDSPKIDLLIKELKIDKLITQYDNIIYLAQLDMLEQQIVRNLTLRNKNIKIDYNKNKINNFIKRFEEVNTIQLAKKQKEAVNVCLNNKISILTGGPGTGKTQTINTIIHCIKTLNNKATIKLLAPTGKAAKRMEELTKEKAKTIHREIGLLPDGTFKDDDFLIETDFLIVDESSMINSFLFYNLLNKTSSDTKIILVGDYNQLPAIGYGLILRDLISSNCIKTITLDVIFRQARESQIVMNSYAILNGKIEELTFDNKKDDFYFIEREDEFGIQKTIMIMINNLINNKNFKIEDIQVLSPIKKGLIGSITLNKEIQNNFNNSKGIDYTKNGNVFKTGDKVMQIENNYDLDVFNGETGIISSIYYNKSDINIIVEFPDKQVIYEKEFIGELELSYSITTHKSQGSEFPVVIIPTHLSQNYMLNRSLLYTATTRAKQMVIIIGQKEALNSSILNNKIINRNTQIKERLIESKERDY